jgi:hypothetical protein
LGSKIKYTPLDEDMKKIAELVKKQRFRNPEAFLDRAIQILLTWELDPTSSMDIMKGYPQTDKQKAMMQTNLKKDVYEEYVGGEVKPSINEDSRLKERRESKNDHLELINNLEDTRTYIRNFKITTPRDSIVPFDNYPILFRFYSRFAPAKIVLAVLADLLRRNPSLTKINLKALRADALDIAAEFNDEIIEFETKNAIKRVKKVSTGFPKLSRNIEDDISVQKRFRDQYIGKTRKDRKDKQLYFEGILAALGFAALSKEGKEEFISLTKRGKEFYLLDNPILNEDYSQGLSKDEREYIIGKIIPEIKLESLFHKVALETVQKYQFDPTLQQAPMAKVLDQEIIRANNEFIVSNQEISKRFEFEPIKYETDEETGKKILDKTDAKYIEGWRVATMGRLSELKQVEWKIEEDTGKSVFRLLDKKETISN